MGWLRGIGRRQAGTLLVLACLAAGGPAGALDLHLHEPVLRIERRGEGRFDLALDVARVAVSPGTAAGRHPLRISDGTIVFDDRAVTAAGAATNACHRAEQVEARTAFVPGAMEIESVALQSCQGRWQAAGHLATGVSETRIRIRADGVALGELVRVFAGRVFEREFGRIAGEIEARGTGRLDGSWWDRATGHGSVQLEGGTLPTFELFAATWKAVRKRVPLLKLGTLEREAAAPSELISFRQSFTLRDGRFVSDDAHLVTDDYDVHGQGSIATDGAIDWDTQLVMTTRGLTKMFSMAHLPFSAGSDREAVTVPIRLTGRLGDPRFRPDLSAVPVSVIAKILAMPIRKLTNPAGELLEKGSGVVRGGLRRLVPGSPEP